MADNTRENLQPRRAASTSLGDSVRLSTPDIVRTLQAGLGQGLLAILVNRDVRTLARWANATVAPPTAAERELRDIFQVFRMIADADSTSVARAWFAGMNPGLDDRSPAETIADGNIREVMAAARHFIAGN